MKGLKAKIKLRQAQEISDQMRKATESVVIPLRPITSGKEPPSGNWLIDLKINQKFIAGGIHDCYLTEYQVFRKNNHFILLQELKVQGKLDLSEYHWVDSELFCIKYKLKDIIEDE